MKVENHTGTVHKVAEVVDTRYFDNVLLTDCGLELYQREFGTPMGKNAKKTRKAVTCRKCKGVK